MLLCSLIVRTWLQVLAKSQYPFLDLRFTDGHATPSPVLKTAAFMMETTLSHITAFSGQITKYEHEVILPEFYDNFIVNIE